MANEVRDAFDSAFVTSQAVTKQTAREIGSVIDGIIDSIQSTVQSISEAIVAGSAIYHSTRSLLYADLSQDDGTLGIVGSDSTADYNGYYLKSGSSGSGSWAKIDGLVLPAEIRDRLTAAEAAIAAEEDARIAADDQLRALAGGAASALRYQSGRRRRFICGTRRNDEFFDFYGPGTFLSWAVGVNPQVSVPSPGEFVWWTLFSAVPSKIGHTIISRPVAIGNGGTLFVRPGDHASDVIVQPLTWHDAADVLEDPENTGLIQRLALPITDAGAFSPDHIYFSVIRARNGASADIAIGVARGRAKVSDIIDPIWRRGVFSASVSSGGIVPTDDHLVAIALHAVDWQAGSTGAETDTTLVTATGDHDRYQSTAADASNWAVRLPLIATGAQPEPRGPDNTEATSLIGVPRLSSGSRYDAVVAHPETGALLVATGTARSGPDVVEYLPAPAGFAPVATLYVRPSGVEVIPSHTHDGLVRRGDEARHLAWINTCRARLPKTMQRLRRGLPLRYVSYGDSIGAVGGGNGTPYEPNGGNRDILSYLSSYDADTLAAIPRFDGDGGAGAHVHIGSDWIVKDAIEDRWGAPVEYLNMCIAGTSSDNSFTVGVGPNGLYAARIEALLSLAPDLVHIRFGMNELTSANTFANIAYIVDAITAAGGEVIVSSSLRPHPSLTTCDWWLYQVRQAIRAAMSRAVAYVDTSRIFGPGSLQCTGLSQNNLCAANDINHPGVRELAIFGKYMSHIF